MARCWDIVGAVGWDDGVGAGTGTVTETGTGTGTGAGAGWRRASIVRGFSACLARPGSCAGLGWSSGQSNDEIAIRCGDIVDGDTQVPQSRTRNSNFLALVSK